MSSGEIQGANHETRELPYSSEDCIKNMQSGNDRKEQEKYTQLKCTNYVAELRGFKFFFVFARTK